MSVEGKGRVKEYSIIRVPLAHGLSKDSGVIRMNIPSQKLTVEYPQPEICRFQNSAIITSVQDISPISP